MIPWWVGLISFAIGEIVGMAIMAMQIIAKDSEKDIK